jgi:hypothetical protein
MSTCDPAYETCPALNSTPAEAPVVTGFNPLIYAWGLIPVLDFVAGFGNKNALNSFLADWNEAELTADNTWTAADDWTWATWSLDRYG